MKVKEALKRLTVGAILVAAPFAGASNHRESPITALDPKADITDLYAFVSYDADQVPGESPEKVTLILCVDPFLEPGNGPNWGPFDPDILYEIKIDNDHDAVEDIVFKFRYETEIQLPDVFTVLAGIGDAGAVDPETGALIVPPQIRDFQNPGLSGRQTYRVSMHRRLTGNSMDSDDDGDDDGDDDSDGWEKIELHNADGSPFFAVPINNGPRTMDYGALFDQATYTQLNVPGISVFTGSVDDPFYLDLGAAFDTANLRTLGSGIPGVLTEFENGAARNFASDTFSGFAVNALALEIPIELLTSTAQIEPAGSPEATIGVWGSTSRRKITIRRSPKDLRTKGPWRQVQRFGNPLINELIIGTGFKNRFSMDEPSNDGQFQQFFLDPPIAQIIEAVYNELLPGALDVPEANRFDLLPLVQYQSPIAAVGTPAGPVADLMRLNTGVPATPLAMANPLGFAAPEIDFAGMPNGRRLFDDAFDIVLRVGVGGVLIPEFNVFPNNVLGDGVNVNDAEFRTTFPYLANCPSGRNRRHVDPGEPFPAPFDNEIVPVN